MEKIEKKVKDLMKELHDESAVDEEVWDMVGVIRALGKKSVPYLISELYNANTGFRVKCAIIQALGKFKDKNATKPLLKLLNSTESGYIAEEIILALGEIGDIRAVEPLIQFLEEQDHYGVLEASAIALGKLKDKRAIEPLAKLTKNKCEAVQDASIEALEKIGGKEAQNIIKEWSIWIRKYHNYVILNK